MTNDHREATISKVLVFKTNILTEDAIRRLAPILDGEKKIFRWNIDRADIDNVLRVEGSIEADRVIEHVCNAGFKCEELPD
jgi:hypothetical protein